MKYEYMIVTDEDDGVNDIQNQLIGLLAEGWELVDSHSFVERGTITLYLAIVRREET